MIELAVPPVLAGQFAYQAGQHLTLRTTIDGADVRRSYSICAAVTENTLRIAVKRVSGGVFSNWANDSVVVGTTIEVMAPTGHFHVPLPAQGSARILAIAAGSGITPILSIIKTTLAGAPHSRATLVYGNRASSSVLFRDELSDLKDRYLDRLNIVYVLSREQQEIELFNGRIDRNKLEALFESWVDCRDIDTAYLCGPLGMMEEARAALQGRGLADECIRVELFASSAAEKHPLARAHPASGANECEVTIVQDGRSSTFRMEKNNSSVLDAALAQGIELPYSCKTGVCSTCRCKRTAGELDMDANFALEDYEIARGFVLACQSYPVSDKLVLDYDQDS